jgi:hypothetical protein
VRSAVIAGVGGALLGHILWLLGMSLATGSSSVSTAVLVVSAALLILAGLLIYQGWQCYQRKQITMAAFLGGLALSPVIFTTVVLGVTYL